MVGMTVIACDLGRYRDSEYTLADSRSRGSHLHVSHSSPTISSQSAPGTPSESPGVPSGFVT